MTSLDNNRLFAVDQHTDEVHRLTEAVGELTHSLKLQDTLKATLQGVERLLGAEAAEVTLYRTHTGMIEHTLSLIQGEWSENGSPHLCDLDRDTVSNLRAALRLPDLQSLPAVINAQHGQGVPFQSFVAVPLRIRDTLTGMLAAASYQQQAFDLNDQRLLQILGSQASFAIRNAQLYEESQRHLREMRALFAIGQSIVSTLDMAEVLDLVANLAIKTIPNATKCVIHLLDRSETLLIPTAIASYKPRTLNSQTLPVGQGIAGHAIAERMTIYVPDCHHDPRYLDLGTQIGSLLSAPLLSSDKMAIGTITVDSESPNSFTADDKRLLTTFAVQSAIAIENAQLFGSLQDAYRELAEKQTEVLKGKNTLQALFDGIEDGISIIDQDYNIVAINQANANLLGQSPADIVGQHCHQLFWHRDTPCPGCPATETFTSGQPAMAMQHVSSHQGRKAQSFEAHTYPLMDEQHRVTQVIFLARNVTNRRNLEASLARSTTMAAVGQLAAGLAHEINNPLTVVLGNAQMLLEDTSPLHPDYPLLEMIIRAGDRAKQVIDRLMEFSAQESRNLSTVDLNETIVSAVALIAHTLRKNDVHITTQLQPGLPHLQGFVGHLQTVWMNLILNAVYAIRGDAYDREVIICSHRHDPDFLQVQVTDRGCGIPQRAVQHLFEPFYSTKGPGKGAGLGLYTCYHIVRRHQGTIKIQSQEGHGTTVIVTLPLHSNPQEGPDDSFSAYRTFETEWQSM